MGFFRQLFNVSKNQSVSYSDDVDTSNGTNVYEAEYTTLTLNSTSPMIFAKGEFKYTKSTNLTLDELIDLVVSKYSNPKGLLFAIPLEIDEFTNIDLQYKVFGTHADNYLIPNVLFACEYGIIIELCKPTDILLRVHGMKHSLFCNIEVLTFTNKVHVLDMEKTDMKPETVFMNKILCLRNLSLYNAFAHTIELKETNYDLSTTPRN